MAFLKSIWKNNTRHHKLSEELALQNAKEAESEPIEMETENDVITFKLKYLGSTVVEKIIGDNINTEAVKNIIKVTKAGRKKLQRVNIAISLKGIAVTDLEGNDILKISIYRISNCSTDPTHRQVFSFISTDPHETMECHAFICSKRKVAETVTLAVAHAFSTAYEAWRILPSTREFTNTKTVPTGDARHGVVPTGNARRAVDRAGKGAESDIMEEKLIDFDDEPEAEDPSFAFGTPPCQENMNSHWVCFEDDFVSETRNAFKTDLIMA